MRPSLWFVIPVHGRLPLAAICLRQLRRTCDALIDAGIDATAVVVADRAHLNDLRRRLTDLGGKPFAGFGMVERDNRFLGRKFNDGIQLALDSKHNPRPADFVVPCGSDDWVDHRLFLTLPAGETVLGFQRIAFVREDGREMTTRFLDYPGGCGIRVYPRRLLERLPVPFRPADEDRVRACDTSILTNLQRANPHMRLMHAEIDPRWIVDWKSAGEQLNPYESLRRHRPGPVADPFIDLADVYPAEALAEMAGHYGRRPQRTLVRA